MRVLGIIIFWAKCKAIGLAFLQKYATSENSYFWVKSKAIGYSFFKKYASSWNYYF